MVTYWDNGGVFPIFLESMVTYWTIKLYIYLTFGVHGNLLDWCGTGVEGLGGVGGMSSSLPFRAVSSSEVKSSVSPALLLSNGSPRLPCFTRPC